MSDVLYTLADVAAQTTVVEAAMKALENEQFKLGNMIRFVHRQTQAQPEAQPVYKDERGKLTELGVRRCNMLLKEDRPTTEIARFFDISEAAVSYRRGKWKEEQARQEARRRREFSLFPPRASDAAEA